MNQTKILVDELKIPHNKYHLGKQNRNIIILNNNIENYYNESYSSHILNPLNTTFINKYKNLHLSINNIIINIIKLLIKNKNKYHLDYYDTTILIKYYYNLPYDDVEYYKTKIEWNMNFNKFKKNYLISKQILDSSDRIDVYKYLIIMLSIMYERILLNDNEALKFCLWYYEEYNNKNYL
jgi:hypothetical protein